MRNINTIDVLCGLSLGGVIAREIWKNQKLGVRNLVLDGAPLIAFPKIMESIMTNSYLNIIHKSKVRDRKTLESFKREFLPERYLESYLKIADNMSDESIKNIIHVANTGICVQL